jgi:hypothetical protein
MEVAKISPYLNNAVAFSSPEGKRVVGEALSRLKEKTESPPPAFEKTPGFRITFNLLADHVQKTKVIFDKGEMEYARFRLNGMTNLCAFCHTQTPVSKTGSPFAAFNYKSDLANFDNASFFFVMRRYDIALSQFEKLIREYPQSGASSEQLSEIFRKRLAIYVRVLRSPKLGALALRDDLKNSKLPSDIRANVKEWAEALDKLAEEPQTVSDMKTPELLAYVTKRMPIQPDRKIPTSDPQLINLLNLSGLLYERLYKEPNGPNTQEILYRLALCERSLSAVIWYSVSEVYLKECVVQFPKQSYSKKCLEAYEDGMRERFFGKPIPDAIQESIKAMKDYL